MYIDYEVSLSGAPFNDACADVHCLLTVPLLFVALLCVMDLPSDELDAKGFSFDTAAAVMVVLVYPGEMQDNPSGRFMWCERSMVTFIHVLAQLVVGFGDARSASVNAPAAGLTIAARHLTVISWCMYPAVYMVKANCATGASTTAAHRIGHACADVVAMAFVLCLIWAIANAKSLAAGAKGFDVRMGA